MKWQLVIAAVLLFYHASTVQAIRYELINQGGGDQDGHTLQGFIEFDSPCGMNCTVENITDFTFSVSGPTVYSYSYQSPADVDIGPGPFLNAGPRELLIDYRRHGGFGLGNASEGSPFIKWFTAFEGHYVSVGPRHSGGWSTTNASPATTSAIGVAIPEPSSVILVFVANLAISCLVRVRTRF